MRLMKVRIGIESESLADFFSVKIRDEFEAETKLVWLKNHEPYLEFFIPYLEVKATQELLAVIRRWEAVTKAEAMAEIPQNVSEPP